jgi:hypothetical protein
MDLLLLRPHDAFAKRYQVASRDRFGLGAEAGSLIGQIT